MVEKSNYGVLVGCCPDTGKTLKISGYNNGSVNAIFLGTPGGGMSFKIMAAALENTDRLIDIDLPKRCSFSKPLKGGKKGVQLSNKVL